MIIPVGPGIHSGQPLTIKFGIGQEWGYGQALGIPPDGLRVGPPQSTEWSMMICCLQFRWVPRRLAVDQDVVGFPEIHALFVQEHHFTAAHTGATHRHWLWCIWTYRPSVSDSPSLNISTRRAKGISIPSLSKASFINFLSLNETSR